MSVEDGSQRAARPREVWLVKLGGSLLTDKTQPDLLHHDRLQRVAREVAAGVAGGRALLLGHGGGSFGHAAADRHGINRGPLSGAALNGIGETQERVRALHVEVLRALVDAGARPFSLSASSFIASRAGEAALTFAPPLADVWASGLLPVVFGDVVADREWGASIASTETIFARLVGGAADVGARFTRALWFGQTEGVYGPDGRTLATIREGQLDTVFPPGEGGAEGADVTGGMRHRVEFALQLARSGVESWIADGSADGAIRRALCGETIAGTCIPPA